MRMHAGDNCGKQTHVTEPGVLKKVRSLPLQNRVVLNRMDKGSRSSARCEKSVKTEKSCYYTCIRYNHDLSKEG